jgi:hypothetical protein
VWPDVLNSAIAVNIFVHLTKPLLPLLDRRFNTGACEPGRLRAGHDYSGLSCTPAARFANPA